MSGGPKAPPYPGRARPESGSPSEDGLSCSFVALRLPCRRPMSRADLRKEGRLLHEGGEAFCSRRVAEEPVQRFAWPGEPRDLQVGLPPSRRLRAYGQKKKCAGAFGRPQLHSVVASWWWNRVWYSSKSPCPVRAATRRPSVRRGRACSRVRLCFVCHRIPRSTYLCGAAAP